jgi:hypothetical protein
MPRRLSLVLLLAICGLGSDLGPAKEGVARQPAKDEPGRVTIHVPGMTERLELR